VKIGHLLRIGRELVSQRGKALVVGLIAAGSTVVGTTTVVYLGRDGKYIKEEKSTWRAISERSAARNALASAASSQKSRKLRRFVARATGIVSS
jgi:hypothetical protein